MAAMKAVMAAISASIRRDFNCLLIFIVYFLEWGYWFPLAPWRGGQGVRLSYGLIVGSSSPPSSLPPPPAFACCHA